MSPRKGVCATQPITRSTTCTSYSSPSLPSRFISAPRHIRKDRETPLLCEDHGTSLLDSWVCHNKVPQTWWLKTTAIYYIPSQFWKSVQSRRNHNCKGSEVEGNLAGVIRIEKTRLRVVGSGSGVRSFGQPSNGQVHT